MSQLPTPASSPLFGGSAECFNCPRAGGWIAVQREQSTVNKPQKSSAHAKDNYFMIPQRWAHQLMSRKEN